MSQTATAIRFSEFGGPEVLSPAEMPLAAPGKGEIQIRQTAIGFNYIDIYHRKGVFGPKLPLPATPGVEGVGEVIAIGPEVAGFAIGDRVAYVGGPPGGYATHRNLPAARALHVPDDLGDALVAAGLFKGLTAEYLTHRCVALRPGDTVLLARGGRGRRLACQPVAERAWRHRHRHCQQRGKGPARDSAGMRACHHLYPRRFPR
jgi:NADPH2:quinone reductase